VEKSHLILQLLLLEEKESNIQIINYIGPSPAGEGFRVRWKRVTSSSNSFSLRRRRATARVLIIKSLSCRRGI
jgi:hypothetical protein